MFICLHNRIIDVSEIERCEIRVQVIRVEDYSSDLDNITIDYNLRLTIYRLLKRIRITIFIGAILIE